MPNNNKYRPRALLIVLALLVGTIIGYSVSRHYVIEDFELRYIPALSFADGAVYAGPLDEQGLASGHGRMEWPNGSYYEGDFVGGLFHGEGHYVGASGQQYQGDYSQGTEQGQGRVTFIDGSEYQGAIARGLLQGHGRLTFVDGSVFEGDFSQDQINGEGRWSVPGNYVYTGGVKDGLFEGPGELIYELQGEDDSNVVPLYHSGAKYLGEFKSGLFHGQGVYESAAGDVYSGNFVYGEFSGQGTYKIEGKTSVGEFIDWLLHGEGIHTNADGDQFKGQFQYGRLNGEGSFIGVDGEQYEGEFNNGYYHGAGVLIEARGDSYSGHFRHGQKHGDGELSYKQAIEGVKTIKGVWRNGRLKEATDGINIYRGDELAEFSLYQQVDLLDQQLAQLAASSGEAINLYTLALASYGSEEVFSRELRYIEENFIKQFSSPAHSVLLANTRRALGERPLATLTSLERSLGAIADTMDKDKDILFLYITSHGSREKRIAFEQTGISLPDLEADKLKSLLDDSGIRWKVVVLSACFSGGFIDALKDENTLIITSADSDRTSFGCSDNSLFTFFGEAFFKQSLPQADSFVDAFIRTEGLISQWEKEQDHKPSKPQISKPKAIIEQLQKWRASRRQLNNQSTTVNK